MALEGRQPITITELGRRLGRPADGLYHHMRALQRAGVATCETLPSRGGRPATAWRLSMKSVNVPSESVSGPRATQAERIARAIVQASLRDYRRALRESATRGTPRPAAGRTSVWLDERERRLVHREMVRLFERLRANEPHPGRTRHVLTYVFAPARRATS